MVCILVMKLVVLEKASPWHCITYKTSQNSIFEIKNIIEDCQSKVTGSIESGLLLWESRIVPFLFNSASTWLDISKNDIDGLTKIQNPSEHITWGVQVYSTHYVLGPENADSHITNFKRKIFPAFQRICWPIRFWKFKGDLISKD